MRLRLGGEGEAGSNGGPAGDLYVVLSVREHADFRRDHTDILSDVAVSFSQAALGAEIRVPTLEGDFVLKVQPGTQSGTRFRLKGRGAPALNGGSRGDQYVTVQLHTPRSLNTDQRELFERLGEIEGETPADRGLFDRVKDIFN
jgi:molecular chaperone DnaJ